LPKARVAAYKVFGYEPDILSAFNHAITDGVDVISISMNSKFPSEFIGSGFAIGSFNVVANGIIIVNSGGNYGPSPYTLTNVEPWVITVAASTTDRDFFSYVTLGNKKVLEGASFHGSGMPSGKFYQLIKGADAKAPKASRRKA
ncbi:subtilisin-like protease, partial [Trifolium medium]|nr:subtilisin-like protease [Trifolium medium]